MVFKDKYVGDFVNKNFVSLRINALIGEGKDIRKKYNIKGFPTVLFLKADGTEVDRICGFDGKKDNYFATLRDYAEGKNTLLGLKTELAKNVESVELNFKIAKKYISRWEWDEAQPYFSKVLKVDPENTHRFTTESKCYLAAYEANYKKNPVSLIAFIKANTDQRFYNLSYSNLIRYYMRQKEVAKVLATFDEALKKMPEDVECLNQYAGYIFSNKVEEKYTLGEKLARKAISLGKEAYRSGYSNLVDYYIIKKDTIKLKETMAEALKKIPDDASLLNSFAWSIYEEKIKSLYEYGIKMAKRAVEIDPQAGNIWDTMGWLYYEVQDGKNAIWAMEKAVQLEPEQKGYQENLKKFKAEFK